GLREVLLAPEEEIVHDMDGTGVPADEDVHQMAPDEPGASGDENGAPGVVHYSILLRIRCSGGNSRKVAGIPIARCQGGTSFVTTAAAATMQPSPSRTPGRIVALPPTVTPRSMIAGSSFEPSRIGHRSFRITQFGPRKTLSPIT